MILNQELSSNRTRILNNGDDGRSSLVNRLGRRPDRTPNKGGTRPFYNRFLGGIRRIIRAICATHAGHPLGAHVTELCWASSDDNGRDRGQLTGQVIGSTIGGSLSGGNVQSDD
ncbi:conserved hypothetical protein [Culex quinquefasciatus]|uniref:Uncharacterized protein n=1 Tax=Culex quinquefasciatus TaxID=7176 RepID=B0WAJ9_CULQU|nr:conserved hypothetical protein [Culex quinquefasciatus]|eukprot:XP_001845733.1 conserved hypothetical protein [Culex quinquefasciatus]